VSALLVATDLKLGYGPLSVCRGLSFEITEVEIVALAES
jgi:ABC-type branched-subunit amino acid transport system ATPase component